MYWRAGIIQIPHDRILSQDIPIASTFGSSRQPEQAPSPLQQQHSAPWGWVAATVQTFDEWPKLTSFALDIEPVVLPHQSGKPIQRSVDAKSIIVCDQDTTWVPYPLATTLWGTLDALQSISWRHHDDTSGQTPVSTNGRVICQNVAIVLDYSSRYATQSYAPTCIAGRPAVFPEYGDRARASVCRYYGEPNAIDYIDMGIGTTVLVTSIQIFETYHCGGVSEIWLFDEGQISGRIGEWVRVWHDDVRNASVVQNRSRVFFPRLSDLNVCSRRVRIVLDARFSEYYPELDALQVNGISLDSVVPTPRSFPHYSNTSASAPPNFPSEILAYIFSKLSTEDLLTRIPRVCKAWRDTVETNAHLYSSLDLQPLWSASPEVWNIARNSLIPLRRKIRRISFKWCSGFASTEFLRAFFGVAARLTEADTPVRFSSMEITAEGSARSFELNSTPTPIDFNKSETELALIFSNLSIYTVKITVPIHDTLTHVDFSNNMKLTDEDVAIVCASTPGLKSLNLWRCLSLSDASLEWIGCAKNLEFLCLYDVSSFSSPGLEALWPNLRQLTHLDLGMVKSVGDAVLASIAANCPLIQDLNLWFASVTPAAAEIFKSAAFLPTITSLNIGWTQISRAMLPVLATKAPRLEKLYLTCNRNINDSALLCFVNHKCALTHVDVMGNRVSVAGITEFVSAVPTLRWMDIGFCSGVDEMSHMSLCAMFPNVVFKRSFT
eukprot:c14563_g1_i1.p1 GENE.c14563_g1_i1~~c14563_g1_i1.p1  ORF type:complete len:746 (+),score=126.76 c14563_g1_i1:76-2238(+)